METEHWTANNPRLRFFADLGSGEIRGETGKHIVERLKALSNVRASRQNVQMCVNSITHELLLTTVDDLYSEVLLVPILRAGLAMWVVANDFFGFPETSFMWGRKEKGTAHASVVKFHHKNVTDKQIIVLDTVIATGDTILQACKQVTSHSPRVPSLYVLSCYASPEGVQAILNKISDVHLIVGCLSKTVSTDGYLIPLTNGDIGDKLFGAIF